MAADKNCHLKSFQRNRILKWHSKAKTCKRCILSKAHHSSHLMDCKKFEGFWSRFGMSSFMCLQISFCCSSIQASERGSTNRKSTHCSCLKKKRCNASYFLGYLGDKLRKPRAMSRGLMVKAVAFVERGPRGRFFSRRK